MSKIYTASMLRRPASPRSDKLKAVTGGSSSSSHSSSSSSSLVPAAADSVFWKYFGLDENGALYVKKKEDGEARDFWTYGNLVAGGINSNGGGGSYVLPVASADTLGGIKVGSGLAIDEDGVLSATGGGGTAVGTLNTNNTAAQAASSSESFSGNIRLHKVSKTGSYTDLLNRPTIPTVNDATLTVRMNGASVGTFTANASSDKTIDLGTVLTSFTETDPVFGASPAAGITAAMIQSWTNKQEPLTAGTDYYTPQTIAQLYQPKMTEGSDYLSPTHVSDRIATALGGLATVASTGDYGDLLNTPTIPVVPTNVSAFTNDAGYLVQADLSGYQTKLSSFNKLNPTFITTNSTHRWWTDSLANTLNAKADDNAVVHLDGYETITGEKYFLGGITVDSTVNIAFGDLNVTLDDIISDMMQKSDFRFDILCKSVLGSDADLNKVYDTSYSDLTGHFRYYAYVGADPWPPVSGTQTTAGAHGFPTTSNANALLTIDTYSESDSLHLYQMGFSGDGNIYFRKGAAVKENGSWIDPWSNGNWNRLLWEDHNGDAAVTRDLSVSRQLNVAGDVVLPQSGGFWFDTAKSYINSAYFVRGDAAENDYSFYLHTGTDGNGNPAAMFIECGALYVNGGNMYLQKGHTLCLDSGGDAYIRRGGASTDYSLYISAGHGSDGTSKVKAHMFASAFCPNSTADQTDLGDSGFMWNNLYVKRWYPDPANAPTAYIEYVSGNPGYFRVHGNIVADGQVAAGGIFSNS